jgi:hypothetical protein
MIFSLKRRQQRKNSWMVIRAINRIHVHDTRGGDIHYSSRSLSNQKEKYFLTS